MQGLICILKFRYKVITLLNNGKFILLFWSFMNNSMVFVKHCSGTCSRSNLLKRILCHEITILLYLLLYYVAENLLTKLSFLTCFPPPDTWLVIFFLFLMHQCIPIAFLPLELSVLLLQDSCLPFRKTILTCI